MAILKFIVANWDSALLIVAAIIGAIVLYKRGNKQLLRSILFNLVTRAEAVYGSGTGELKKVAVIEWLYNRMPAVLRMFFTVKDIEALIDDVLVYAKEKWASNPALLPQSIELPELNLAEDDWPDTPFNPYK